MPSLRPSRRAFGPEGWVAGSAADRYLSGRNHAGLPWHRISQPGAAIPLAPLLLLFN